MFYALLIARVLLSAVFAVAGAAKLADQAGSRQALIGFGVPRALVGPGGILLPLVELAIAALLLPVATTWASAIGALFLLLCFLLAIGINLARGRTPDCHCFGQLHSAPAGWSVLARNMALAGFAGLVVWHGRYDPGPSVVAWLPDLTTAGRIGLAGCGMGLALFAIQTALLLQVLKQQGRILLRLERLEVGPIVTTGTQVPAAQAAGLPIGMRAPTFLLGGLGGETITLEALAAEGKPVLLLFTNPHCGPCQALMPEIGRWQREHANRMIIALVSEGTVNENRAENAAHGVNRILLQKKREIADAYKAWGTPGAVLIGAEGIIASPLAQGADAIRALVAQITGAELRPVPTTVPPTNGQRGNGHARLAAAAKVGDRVPPLKLRDLNGKTVVLNDLDGETLVLFWNPGCGFCQTMLRDLRQWEAEPPPGAPRLLLISAGTVEENRIMGLRSPVLLDQASEVGSAFGANGTPMAVLVDAQGRIASEVAAGAQAVFALASTKRKEQAPLGSAANLQSAGS